MNQNNTKELLINNIRKWVKLDNELRALKKEESARKKQQKELNTQLIDLMKQNEIDNIDIKGGQICYNQKNIKKPITKKYLLEILAKYYQGDMDKAESTNEFILNNREEVTKETITRKFDKN
tara:strand:- start:63 stop:428 length:366 start_codon:yes stop_codon:yes gene_type:complete